MHEFCYHGRPCFSSISNKWNRGLITERGITYITAKVASAPPMRASGYYRCGHYLEEMQTNTTASFRYLCFTLDKQFPCEEHIPLYIEEIAAVLRLTFHRRRATGVRIQKTCQRRPGSAGTSTSHEMSQTIGDGESPSLIHFVISQQNRRYGHSKTWTGYAE